MGKKVLSEEHRKKLSEAAKRRWWNMTAQEYETLKEKQREAMKRYHASLTKEEKKQRNRAISQAKRGKRNG